MVNALNFKEIGRGSLLGFFDLRYEGIVIRGCRLLEGQHGRFIGLPQNKSEKNGEASYHDIVEINQSERAHVTKIVLADLEQQGRLAREPRKTTRRTDPMDEDLSAYKTGPEPGGLPF